MRFLVPLIVVFIAVIMIIGGIFPNLLQPISPIEGNTERVFKRGMTNIDKLERELLNWKEEINTNKEFVEDDNKKREDIFKELEDALKEMRVVLAYQHYLILQMQYNELLDQSRYRQVDQSELNRAFRAMEDANIYLNRLLKDYPQAEQILK